jgi:drug/metabolite transporter (DMT)-like permease
VIVFTALIDWIVWHNAPGPLVFLGMALVIGGGLVAVRAKTSRPDAIGAPEPERVDGTGPPLTRPR